MNNEYPVRNKDDDHMMSMSVQIVREVFIHSNRQWII